jgi:hypothetical protein
VDRPARHVHGAEGNSQSLDHTLLTDNLFNQPFAYDILHVNAEFATQASDHDPQVVRLSVEGTPSAPSCDGQDATISVNAEGRIVGPDNGRPYRAR